MPDPKFSDTLKAELRGDGWHSHELCEERLGTSKVTFSDSKIPDSLEDFRSIFGEPDTVIHLEDDTWLRLEGERMCMMCGVLVGSILFMAIMFAAIFWHDLEITQRLTALLYGEVV